ncbi:RNA polymerase sigma factor [Sphingobacterium bovistauri]|uniref:Sigma-70 family RNA polymerase sigma factor n=1 Tax=Sphingobacterium bovistauri TaxID=2781959 RepID=A0ABS7Z0U6_9SPHI|nr:sigma-70 family RNA polymerase sigma factor [Sphingobacterium bovistauri]MCA5003751.1 sigma-70 family RNA polymerase sigma factor [Sphingobacterium bovistauri]
MDKLYIDKVLAGDLSAFNYFLKTYKDMAYSVAISIVKQEHLAEEIVQDAFMICYQSLKNFKGNSKFSTWLYRIVVNCAYGTLRKTKNNNQEFDVEVHDVSFDESTFQLLEKKEKEHMVQEALLNLPANEALALRLFYLEELSVQEVREVTGWTETNIKTILHRGRKRLYAILSKLMKGEYYGIAR